MGIQFRRKRRAALFLQCAHVLRKICAAFIYRLLDALRIFDLIYVLTPNSSATKTMSVISRENLIDFDKFAYGSAQSTLLFLIIALSVVLYIWLGRVDLGGQKQ